MTAGVIITAIICVTLIIICLIPRRKEKDQEYEYNVIHVTLPREKQHTGIMEGIRAGLSVFGGEVVAIINEPYYPDMKAPMYQIIFKCPVKHTKYSKPRDQPDNRPGSRRKG